jgi:hypothetical protein
MRRGDRDNVNAEGSRMKSVITKASFLALCISALVVGCGGGGSPTVPSSTPDSTTPTTTAPTTTAQPSLSVALYSGTGVSTNIGLSGSYVARATLKDASGATVAGRTVTFALPDESFAKLSPTSALTSSAGVAEVSIAPASLTASGASTLTVTATIGAATVTGSVDFSVSAPSLSLSAITATSTSLASGGNSNLSVSTLIGGQPLTAQPANVAFTTTCGRINSIDTGTTVTTNGSGVATVTYSAINGAGDLCSGPVTVNATTAGASSVGIPLTVAAPTATAVTFVGASTNQIYVAGAGNAEQSILSFKVLSSVNTPLVNQVVNFSLIQNPAGVTLNQTSAVTDSSGLATVTISAGTVPGPLKIRAALASNATLFAESQNLTVASGPPSQKFMSLSVSKFNLEAASIDGASSILTVRIADRQGNAVADGTVVNFTAEGGQVGSSCATSTVDKISACSVNFISQNPRPANGRVSVLAYLEGTKDYVDLNGNNRYDAGVDTLVQAGDAYRDDNENLLFDASVDGFVFTRGVTGACNPQANGSLPSRIGTCSVDLATTVRQMAVLNFASSSAVFTETTDSSDLGRQIDFLLGSSGYPLLPMPAGTEVEATVIDNTSGNAGTCTLTDFTGTTVVDVAPKPGVPNEDLRTRHSAMLKDCARGDVLKVAVTSPSGVITPKFFNIP